jgi:alcohol dehydrogenase class IV
VRGKPLIAIPTTAGTGSEMTQFSTLYIDNKKHSISDPVLLPEVAIVDPELTRTLPPYLTATSGMDALSQAIESYWSVNSTDESKGCAEVAIRSIVPALKHAVCEPDDESRRAMARAANYAGRAINITRTTAPHALSYALTAGFGVPHGQAVALTLPLFFGFNHGVTEMDVADARGATYVRRMLEELSSLLGCSTVTEAGRSVQDLMNAIGLATSFQALGIDKQKAIDTMAAEVNTERLVNNPRRVTSEQIVGLVHAL